MKLSQWSPILLVVMSIALWTTLYLLVAWMVSLLA